MTQSYEDLEVIKEYGRLDPHDPDDLKVTLLLLLLCLIFTYFRKQDLIEILRTKPRHRTHN